MSSGEAYYSPLWDDYLTQPSVILGLGDNIMYCVLSRLPKSCINFLFLGPGNFWDTDKKEKGMILEETIPRIFLLTPSLDVVWGEGAGGFPFPFGEAPVAPFNQVPWWVHTHSPYPLKFPSPPPHTTRTIPFSLFPHLQGQLEQIRCRRKPGKESQLPTTSSAISPLAPTQPSFPPLRDT